MADPRAVEFARVIMTPERWSEIDGVFQHAAELNDSERSEFLSRSCRGDDELRREVESLLASDRGWGGAVHQAVRQHADAVATEHTRALIGEKIGAYRILDVIGRGGMGAVYLAERDDREFGKTVAIKLMHHGMASDLFIGYFRRERQILSMLEHPNIARLYDGGTMTDGRPYFVMEYVPGRPVNHYCNQQRLDIRQRVLLFRHVCEAVAHAHRNLVVHRDIKPENILVSDDGTPKLLDFGVARLLDPNYAPGQTNTLVLTPHYSSPEQIRGEPPTTAMDIYSLGAVLHELLTGRRVRCDVDCGLSPDLGNILAMALRDDPALRYRSVEQFSDDLGRYLSGMPVLARQDSFRYRAGKYIRRNAMPLGAAAAVAASLIVGTAVSTVQAQRAQRRFENVRKLANVMLFDLNDKVRILPGSLQARELMARTGLEYLDGLVHESGGNIDLTFDLARGYERVASLQSSPDPAERTLDRRAEGLASYRRALTLAQAVERERPSNPEVMLLLANVHLGVGANTTDPLERERSFNAGLALLDKIPERLRTRRWEPDGPPLIRYLGHVVKFSRSVPLMTRGDFRAAAKAGSEAGPDLGPHLIVPSLHGMGDLTGALKKSYEFLESREARWSRGSDDILTHINRISYARATSWIGRILGDEFAPNLGDPERARQVLSRGMDIVRLAIARDPQDPAARRALRMCELSLADSMVSSNPAKATAIYARILDGAAGDDALRPGLPEQNALWKIAYPLMRQGQYEEALKRARSATQSMRSPRSELALADALTAVNGSGVHVQFDRAIRAAEKRMSERPQDMHARNDLAIAHESHGRFLLSQGDCEAARRSLAAALGVWREWPAHGVSSAYNLRREQSATAQLKRVTGRRCAS